LGILLIENGIFKMRDIFLILFLIKSLNIFSQGFSLYPNGSDFPAGISCTYLNNTIILNGIELDQMNLRQGIGFYMLDTLGIVLKKNTNYKPWRGSRRLNIVDTEKVLVDDKIWIIYNDGDSTGLIGIDTGLNLTVLPGFKELLAGVTYVDIKFKNGKFYLAGFTLGEDPANSSDIAAACLDGDGNLLWQKQYPRSGFQSSVKKMIFSASNSIILLSSGGRKSVIRNCGNDLVQNYLEIDTFGNLIRNNFIASDIPESAVFDFYFLSDGKYIYASLRGIPFMNGSLCDPLWAPYISLKDKNHTLLKRRFLQSGRFPFEPSVRMARSGNDFVVAASTYDTIKNWIVAYAYLEKLDSNLNTIWIRRDTTLGLGAKVVYGMDMMPSGSILVTGTLMYAAKNRGYIYKVNADGCMDWSFCGTPSSLERIYEEPYSLTAFPNPSSSNIMLALDGLWRPGMQWDIYDILGRKIKSLPAEAFGTQVEIAEFNAGIYRGVLMEKGKVLGSVGFSKVD
jgi:hypothetical protein